MLGIDLNEKIEYKSASLRFFNKGERHISRRFGCEVLIMVYDGILRFSEDGEYFEVRPGEYHIQKRNTYQDGYAPSDSPQYLYIHFNAEWNGSDHILPKRGTFDTAKLRPLMEQMDKFAHNNSSYTHCCSIFYQILTQLITKPKKTNVAIEMAEYIKKGNLEEVSLDTLCQKFNFSKNHIINLFKAEFGTTPVKYINSIKLNHAKYLLEVTSNTTESIAQECGFNEYSHFYRLFMKDTGLSPTHWREQKQHALV